MLDDLSKIMRLLSIALKCEYKAYDVGLTSKIALRSPTLRISFRHDPYHHFKYKLQIEQLVALIGEHPFRISLPLLSDIQELKFDELNLEASFEFWLTFEPSDQIDVWQVWEVRSFQMLKRPSPRQLLSLILQLV